MRVFDNGTKRDHVHPGNLLADDSAFESGVNRFDLRRFTQMIADVWCEAFRAAEEGFDAGLLQGRNTFHRLFEYRFHVLEVAGDFVETKILGYAIHAPRSSIRFEGTDHELTGVVLIVGARVVIAQYGHVLAQTGDVFK